MRYRSAFSAYNVKPKRLLGQGRPALSQKYTIYTRTRSIQCQILHPLCELVAVPIKRVPYNGAHSAGDVLANFCILFFFAITFGLSPSRITRVYLLKRPCTHSGTQHQTDRQTDRQQAIMEDASDDTSCVRINFTNTSRSTNDFNFSSHPLRLRSFIRRGFVLFFENIKIWYVSYIIVCRLRGKSVIYYTRSVSV